MIADLVGTQFMKFEGWDMKTSRKVWKFGYIDYKWEFRARKQRH